MLKLMRYGSITRRMLANIPVLQMMDKSLLTVLACVIHFVYVLVVALA